MCVAPGNTCNVDTDCCTPPCTKTFRCTLGSGGKSSSGASGTSGTSGTGTSGTSGTSGSGTSGASSSGSSCSDLYTLCAVDSECCTGLSCTMGSCR